MRARVLAHVSACSCVHSCVACICVFAVQIFMDPSQMCSLQTVHSKVANTPNPISPLHTRSHVHALIRGSLLSHAPQEMRHEPTSRTLFTLSCSSSALLCVRAPVHGLGCHMSTHALACARACMHVRACACTHACVRGMFMCVRLCLCISDTAVLQLFCSTVLTGEASCVCLWLGVCGHACMCQAN